jgi:3-hydroxyacyl-CoA dehydrogenase
MTDEQIVERVLYPLVNEGFKCLEEGIAASPSDIDVVYLLGYGFPVWRGGPMHWADHQVGLPNLLRSLQDFSRDFPGTEHYVPSKLLEECVRLGVTVEEYYRRQQMKNGAPRSSRL